jgi:NAD(P)-dependent dehydrogenase (short-subunit alcohol dehydrogenase family)
LITGAAKRLGRVLALALAEQGVHIILHYHRSDEAARSVVRNIQDHGVSCWTVRADLTDTEQAEPLFTVATQQAGPVDILINNASFYQKMTFDQTTPAAIQKNMNLHAVSPLILARCLARQERPGHVINLLDTRAVCRDPLHVPYHLSKRTLLTLTRLMAEELAPTVAVNGIAPGLILAPEDEADDYLEKLAHTNPLNRYGAPSDIANAALFLLRSRFITGQILFVDGGHHMKGRLYE